MAKRNADNLLEPAVALRHLADSVGRKWNRMLQDDCTGLGHIHDIWKEMYDDMESIVCLEKFIVENDKENGLGVDFLPTIGFPQYKVKKEDE